MFKKVNSPLPQSLQKECGKAAKIFASFVDSGNNGLDGVVPRVILERAKGFAIFSVVKAGFVFSARAGSGIVIARLEDGSWSAPSAIGTAGLGFGGQAGAEVTDFLIVLNSRSALRSFMSAGSLTLGGNLSLAVGPIGRNGEAIGSLSSSGKVAAMYSYSKTRGLFGGVSLEGSVIVERQDANAIAYRSDDVTVKMLLSGSIPPPEWASPLIKTLEACTGMPGGRKWVFDTPQTPGVENADPFGAPQPPTPQEYAFGGLGSTDNTNSSFLAKRKLKKAGAAFPPASWGRGKSTGSYFDDYGPPSADENGSNTPSLHSKSRGASDDISHRMRDLGLQDRNSTSVSAQPFKFDTHFESDFVPEDRAKQHPHLVNDHSSVTRDYNLVDVDEPKSTYASNSVASTTRAGLGSVHRPPSISSASNPFFTVDDAPSTIPPYNSGYQSSHTGSGGFHHQTSNAFTPPLSNSATRAASFLHARTHSPASTYATALDDDYGAPDVDTHRISLGGRGTTSPAPHLSLKPELTQPLPPYALARAIALYNFDAVQPGDLSFKEGQVILITEKSDSSDTWWKGTLDGRSGSFPANFVELA